MSGKTLGWRTFLTGYNLLCGAVERLKADNL